MEAGSVVVELLVDAHAKVGEGPFWHPEEGVLYWVDITGCLVHRYDPGTGTDDIFAVGQEVGAARPRQAGGLVLAVRDGFVAFDPASGHFDPLAEVERDLPGNRMNDGACDSSGRFWAGTMPFAENQPTGALYCLGTDRKVERLLDGVTISNGIGWSLDDRTMYYIDSPTMGVDAFDYDPGAGTIANRRRLITITGPGVPDGMTVDGEGFLWVAVWGGWGVQRFTPDGRLDRVISLPVSQVSACTFGGEDLQDLYITSAAANLSAVQLAREPYAGGLFRCRPGVQGLAVQIYRG